MLTRRIYVVANNVIDENKAKAEDIGEQINLFANFGELNEKRIKEQQKELKEKEMQKAILNIKKKYGKNAILKGMNFEDCATMIDRNRQIGGHRE